MVQLQVAVLVAEEVAVAVFPLMVQITVALQVVYLSQMGEWVVRNLTLGMQTGDLAEEEVPGLKAVVVEVTTVGKHLMLINITRVFPITVRARTTQELTKIILRV